LVKDYDSQRFIEMKDCFSDTKTNLEWAKEDLLNRITSQQVEELITLIEFSKSDPATKLPNIISSFLRPTRFSMLSGISGNNLKERKLL